MNRKHALKDMTFVEFRDRLAERPVILLPFGSQEEQGPHAPMGDFMLTERLALLAAEAADAIAAPTVPFGHADLFRALPGGIQLRATTFTAVLTDIVDSLLEHGVGHLVVLNGHTSNAPLIEQALHEARRRHGIVVPAINVWRAIPASLWQRLHGPNAQHAQGHGGDPISSVYLHLFPEHVRRDLERASAPRRVLGLEPSGGAAVAFEGLPVQLPLMVTEVEPDGLIGGDARLASPEIGAAIVDHLTGFIARFCDHFRHCDPRAVATEPRT